MPTIFVLLVADQQMTIINRERGAWAGFFLTVGRLHRLIRRMAAAVRNRRRALMRLAIIAVRKRGDAGLSRHISNAPR